jgi:HNH endonuclease
VKEIPLTRGRVALVSNEDFDLVSKHRWHVQYQSDRTMYAQTRVKQKAMTMHRLIMGFPASGIDHIDGNGLNNTRENLRLATVAQNQWNSRIAKNNKSGFKGVCLRQGRWTAQMSHLGQKIYLGTFPTAEIASMAYQTAAKELRGEFARS